MVFESISAVGTKFAEIVQPHVDETQSINIASATRKDLFLAAANYLEQHPADGVGLIFQRELMAASSPELEWWIRDGEKFTRQEFVNDPDSPLFYDYEQLEWFRGGFGAEARTVAGPYIDYLGVNDYVTTWTIPFVIHDRTVGVVGIDIKISTLEKVLIPKLLKAVDRRAALVNENKQIIVSTIGPLPSGTLVETVPEGYVVLPLEVDKLDLALLVKSE
ncbi:hypothetical protein A6F49_02650 [Enteractinococcus helveticum]|uniref:Cache domain-containing protein n=2 Tax=Enteractinococcus helveticum TaxID=1837282 RepID=A0A1B7LUG2_9MICC|nr:hypothetical protein A6F49_02650 [Enteractinococcus helveticum]